MSKINRLWTAVFTKKKLACTARVANGHNILSNVKELKTKEKQKLKAFVMEKFEGKV